MAEPIIQPYRPAWEREFPFSDREFAALQALAATHAGIHLSDAKRELVYARLAKRIRALGLRSFREYCERLRTRPDEIEPFTNAITTNLTSFFREPHHFEFLRDTIVPDWIDRQLKRPMRIWCAGCSTGEEPYSAAAAALTALGSYATLRVLATDLDSQVLAHADRGVYELADVMTIPEQYRKRFFQRGHGSRSGLARAAPPLRKAISFQKHNLVHQPPPAGGPFDVIFCRNVVIYFDRETQRQVTEKLVSTLEPQGSLLVGHSESLLGRHADLQLVGQAAYRRRS